VVLKRDTRDRELCAHSHADQIARYVPSSILPSSDSDPLTGVNVTRAIQFSKSVSVIAFSVGKGGRGNYSRLEGTSLEMFEGVSLRQGQHR